MGTASNIHKTEDGFLNAFQVNYLGNVLLTVLLLEHFNEKESKYKCIKQGLWIF